METFIIGVYDDPLHAQSAKNELLASGFSRRNVQLNPDPALAATKGTAIQSKQDNSISASIGNFFRSMFFSMGDKSTLSHVYAEAVRRGSSVLTVDTINDEQRVLAEEIMHRFNPIDIEERSSEWVRHGWRGYDPDAPMMSHDEIHQERSKRAAEKAGDQTTKSGTVRTFQRGKGSSGQDQ
jgi:hypothetical protein